MVGDDNNVQQEPLIELVAFNTKDEIEIDVEAEGGSKVENEIELESRSENDMQYDINNDDFDFNESDYDMEDDDDHVFEVYVDLGIEEIWVILMDVMVVVMQYV